MKILFDQGTPVPLRKYLEGHSVDTAFERGWSAIQNTHLLKMAEQNGYDLLVTTDQNMKYQQNLRSRKLAILVLATTSWRRLSPHAKSIGEAINGMQTGEYKEFVI